MDPTLHDINGTILHVGTGASRCINYYLQSHARQIILVTPISEDYKLAWIKSNFEKRVKVSNATVNKGGGTISLYCYNLHEIVALQPIFRNSGQWPGLSNPRILEVDSLTPDELLKNIHLEVDRKHALVVSLPSDASDILHSLDGNNAEGEFSYVLLLSHKVVEKAQEAHDDVKSLEDFGYKFSHSFSAFVGVEGHCYFLDKPYSRRLTKNKKPCSTDGVNEVKASGPSHEENLDFSKIDSLLIRRKNQIIDDVEKLLFNYSDRILKQSEAYLEVKCYFGIESRLPEFHGWAVSPDFGLYLIDLISSNDYDCVLEFGSGTTTVLVSKALNKKNYLRGENGPIHVAFEHDEKFHEKTNFLVNNLGGYQRTEVFFAPLENFVSASGRLYPYYSCSDRLEMVRQELVCKDIPNVLVIVDGPPGNLDKHARYPALSSIINTIKKANYHFLIDDYKRMDEKQIVEIWKKELKEYGVVPHCHKLRMDKGACLLSFSLI
jgi:hypothetical protein